LAIKADGVPGFIANQDRPTAVRARSRA